MPFDINTFRSSLALDGARPTQFMVTLLPPVFAGLLVPELSLMCEGTALPPSTIGEVEMSYFGRKTYHAGDRVIQDWNIQVINDESFVLYAAFERWINAMAQSSTRASAQRTGGATSLVNSYTGTGTITHFGKDGTPVRNYTMTNVWPTNLSGIQLSWDANNQIERFSVTLKMDWYETADGAVN